MQSKVPEILYFLSRLKPWIARKIYSIPYRTSSVESPLPPRVKLQPYTKISHSLLVPRQGTDLFIDSYSSVGAYAYLGPGLANIGKFCSIAPFAFISPVEHDITKATSSNAISIGWLDTLLPKGRALCQFSSTHSKKRTLIGNDVWIGAHVFIKEGLRIGNGSIVGAGSVVLTDVPPYSIVAGVPARVIRMRFAENVISYLLSIDWQNISLSEMVLHDRIVSDLVNQR